MLFCDHVVLRWCCFAMSPILVSTSGCSELLSFYLLTKLWLGDDFMNYISIYVVWYIKMSIVHRGYWFSCHHAVFIKILVHRLFRNLAQFNIDFCWSSCWLWNQSNWNPKWPPEVKNTAHFIYMFCKYWWSLLIFLMWVVYGMESNQEWKIWLIKKNQWWWQVAICEKITF
jgi:hypothetical protein